MRFQDFKNHALALMILISSFPFPSRAETDSLGAPLLFREMGALYDEYGPVLEDDGITPKSCQIEMFSHYFRISVGFGNTLGGHENAAKLMALSTGNSSESFTFVNNYGLYIAAVPMISRNQVEGRQLLSGMVVNNQTEDRNYLNILTFHGGVLSEYEVRVLAMEADPKPFLSFKVGQRPASLKSQTTPWNKPKYYMYARCLFQGVTS